MWIGIIKTENKGIGIRLGIKKKELNQELELKKWNWTQVYLAVEGRGSEARRQVGESLNYSI